MTWTCATCQTENKARAKVCEGCLQERSALGAGGKPLVCFVDGTPLTAEGFCRRGNGYPGARACPFVCPLCRQPLGWDGSCDACRGSGSPGDRRTWTFPGDRYDWAEGHWVLSEKGPRPAMQPEEVLALVRELVKVLDVFDRRARLVAAGVSGDAPEGPSALQARRSRVGAGDG